MGAAATPLRANRRLPVILLIFYNLHRFRDFRVVTGSSRGFPSPLQPDFRT